MSYTYAVLDVSQACYDEIRRKLVEAGYQHAFEGDVIDMHGIALAVEEKAAKKPKPKRAVRRG